MGQELGLIRARKSPKNQMDNIPAFIVYILVRVTEKMEKIAGY